jgi:predicted deacetylase
MNSRAEYLLRLDDACPTMDHLRWDALETVLRRYRIRPIVAIIPANADPSLIRDQPDSSFWQRARSWESEGWMIGLHGYSHSLKPSGGGMVPVGRRSEFVGLPPDEQRKRIREGVQLFRAEGISPKAWVAPAHGLDRWTLEALRTESDIRVISDSLARRPIVRKRFVWIPQQLWHPREMAAGVWTICLHPNEMDGQSIQALGAFIKRHRRAFGDPAGMVARAVPRNAADILFENAFLVLLWIKNHGRR